MQLRQPNTVPSQEDFDLVETQQMYTVDVSPDSLLKTEFIQMCDAMIEGGFLNPSFLIILIKKLSEAGEFSEEQTFRLLNALNDNKTTRLKETVEA